MDLRAAWEELAQNRGMKIAELANEIATLRTKLAMREQQLREADAEVTRLKAEAASVGHVDRSVAHLFTEALVAASPEPWEAIVTAAIRWRRGADRGELARAVDAFTGDGPLDVHAARLSNAMKANPDMGDAIMGKMVSDLKGLAARESASVHQMPVLRPEQYADGAGAQAWRQAMSGKPTV